MIVMEMMGKSLKQVADERDGIFGGSRYARAETMMHVGYSLVELISRGAWRNCRNDHPRARALLN